jgi:class 3 adenylate cyclase
MAIVSLTAGLFTDNVGLTDTAARLGDRRWRELLDYYDAMIAAEVLRFRGQLIRTTGDGALATFDRRQGQFGARARCATPRERSKFSFPKVST